VFGSCTTGKAVADVHCCVGCELYAPVSCADNAEVLV
jgi:hypothetical protein